MSNSRCSFLIGAHHPFGKSGCRSRFLPSPRPVDDLQANAVTGSENKTLRLRSATVRDAITVSMPEQMQGIFPSDHLTLIGEILHATDMQRLPLMSGYP
ncbi:hypothetical protein ACWGQL_17855 [Streptomyces lydicus]